MSIWNRISHHPCACGLYRNSYITKAVCLLSMLFHGFSSYSHPSKFISVHLGTLSVPPMHFVVTSVEEHNLVPGVSQWHSYQITYRSRGYRFAINRNSTNAGWSVRFPTPFNDTYGWLSKAVTTS